MITEKTGAGCVGSRETHRVRLRVSRALALWPVCVAFAHAGCMAPRRVEPLSDAVRSYNDAVRWQRFDMAATRLVPEKRGDFLDLRDRLSDELRITGYEVIRSRRDDTGRQVKVHVKYTWYLDSQGVVRTTHTVQSWERPRNTWILVAEKYLRGRPMPGVEVPDEDIPEADASDRAEDEPGHSLKDAPR